ncbi:MAG: ribonuclease HII [Alphaproteobacteria bacterium]|nr:ribonuclease HII [Alphaproteobacteria bacterium]
MPDLAHEKKLGGRVAGVDEAGRGPLAGPVVAAAVVFLAAKLPPSLAGAIDDSKKLTAARREAAFAELRAHAKTGTLAYAIAAASVKEIDTLNILRATHLAMRRAVERLGVAPDVALVDGNQLPRDLPCRTEGLVKGDAKSLSIAAASILAKVTRDRIMALLDARHPGYGWASNKGYGSAAHIESIAVQGPSAHHRLSFAPLAQGHLSL